MASHRPIPRAPLALAAIGIAIGVAVTGCGDTDATTGSIGLGAAQIAGAAAESTDPTVEVTPVAGEPDRSPRPTAVPSPAPTPTSPPPPSPTPEPTPVVRPAAPSGRTAPAVALTAAGLADQIVAAETAIRDPASSAAERADWGHMHQVAIRSMGYRPEWDADFFEALPPELRPITLLHVSARRALTDLSSGYDAADFVPAWEIVEPEPAVALLSYYVEAEEATGIEWEYLAAINLIETGMGRIRGLSSAGAQGPMQFLPTTWAEAGIGAGDIEDPHDAIQAAARYLVRRGGPADMAGALWGYNNSDDYVTAVQAYAEVLRQDPAAYETIYNWEIYFFTEAGDVWLPAGFITEERLDLADFLAENPWSAPDAGLR